MADLRPKDGRNQFGGGNRRPLRRGSGDALECQPMPETRISRFAGIFLNHAS
jgi:hypothetical protein